VFMIRLTISGYLKGERQFHMAPLEIPVSDLESIVPAFALRHALAFIRKELDMIEFEFLDEPDPNDRFLRIGPNPQCMVRSRLIS
jgi:hypothetical protein